jgi:hypothetical protein
MCDLSHNHDIGTLQINIAFKLILNKHIMPRKLLFNMIFITKNIEFHPHFQIQTTHQSQSHIIPTYFFSSIHFTKQIPYLCPQKVLGASKHPKKIPNT